PSGTLGLSNIRRTIARDAQRLPRRDSVLCKSVPAPDVLHADIVSAGNASERIAAIHAIVERPALWHGGEHRLCERELCLRARTRGGHEERVAGWHLGSRSQPIDGAQRLDGYREFRRHLSERFAVV